MKNKIKKLKLPLNKMTGNEKDYTAVLLEDVNSNMKAFWEVLSGTQNDVTELKAGMEELKERSDAIEIKLDTIEIRLDTIEIRLDTIEIRLDKLIEEVSFIRDEIKSLKTSLLAKADKEKLEILELKIIKIEKYLKLS